MTAYTTLAQTCQIELTIQNSRFLADGQCVHSASEAEAFLKQIQQRYPDANHHCYAFKVLGPPLVDRFSDDGEPNGTAGRPIYTVLEHNLSNAIIVVTRYFGGTKLGKGGLVKAYTQSAQALIEAAGVIQQEPELPVELTYPYALSGSLEHLMAGLDLQPELEYAAHIQADIKVPESVWPVLQERLTSFAGQGLTWTLPDSE